jgi:hypothetical protein
LLKRMHMFVAVATLMAVMLLVSAAVAFAANPDDPKTVFCKGDNYLIYGVFDPVTETVTPFNTQGDCVSFVESGGVPVPIEVTV